MGALRVEAIGHFVVRTCRRPSHPGSHLQALALNHRAGVPAGAVIRPFGRACVPETFACGLLARRCCKLPPVRGGALRTRTPQCEFSVTARARQQLFSVFSCFVEILLLHPIQSWRRLLHNPYGKQCVDVFLLQRAWNNANCHSVRARPRHSRCGDAKRVRVLPYATRNADNVSMEPQYRNGN